MAYISDWAAFGDAFFVTAFVLRENTERPEAIEAKVAKLVGGNPVILHKMLEENYAIETWIKSVKEIRNPFGDGKAAKRIVKIIEEKLNVNAFQRSLFRTQSS